jgi:hypothetical protein
MAITVKHKFVSAIPDAGDPTIVQPSNWNDTHQLIGVGTMAEQNANSVAITGGTISGVAVTGYVPTTETITAGTGLTGGGDLSANRTIALANTAVTTGTYGNASRTITQTVDQQGRLTNIFDQPIAIANTQVSGLGTASTKDAGVANGVATLDSGGQIPLSQIPPLGDLNYQGTWNATTNTPTLTSSLGTKGYYYVVSVAGTTNLNGITDWQVSDWAVFNGSVWQKIDNTDLVTSVNGYTGAVNLTYTDVGAFPATSTTGTGNVVLATGATQAHPTISDYEKFTSTSPPSYAEGELWYDSTQKALTYFNDVTNNQVHIGQEVQLKVINNTGSSITNGTPVYVTGTSSGQSYPNIALAKADTSSTSAVLGLTNGTIASGAVGYVCTAGLLTPCNTGSFTVGQVLYLSPYSAGQLMNTVPPTGYAVQVGVVAYANSPNGSIYVKQTTPLAVSASTIIGQVAVSNGGTGAATLTGYVKGSGTSAFTASSTIPTTDLSGTVTNAQLTNSAITINGTSTSLGGSISVGTVTSVAATAGTGISVTGSPITGSGTLNITNTAPDQTVAIASGTGISVTGTYPNFTVTNTSPSSGGTVTSVALTAPSIFTVTGSPITSSGTLALTYSGTALPILNGGTGQTTANAAFNALAPSQTNNSGKYLTTDGTNTSWASLGNTYTRTSFTATAAQTTFTVTYTVGLVEVYVNGVFLNGADFTATNGTSVVLAVACNAGDIVETVAFSSFSVANTVSSFSGGTTGLTPSTATTGNVTLSGTLAVANGGTGVTSSTGSGSVVLGTSPTIATPTITSLYGQNSNLVKTPYNGTGLIPAELFYSLNTAYTGTTATTAQSFLGVGVTVAASTIYQFEGLFAMSKTLTATAHNIQIGFGGTATLNNINYIYYGPQSSITSFNDTNNGALYGGLIQVATATTVASTSAAAVYKIFFIKGIVSINAAGTFIPQYTISAAVGPYTTQIGSYFKLSPLGASGSNTSIGTWA